MYQLLVYHEGFIDQLLELLQLDEWMNQLLFSMLLLHHKVDGSAVVAVAAS